MTAASHRLLFARKFFRHGTAIASITPSSRWMAAELARHVDPARPQRILELGAGTGSVTRAIVERMHPASTLLALEPDPDFAAAARVACPRARVLACRFEGLPDAESGPFDVVVSGMPVPSFKPEVRRALFGLIARRAPGAVYSQLTEVPLVYRGVYTPHFAEVRFALVARNIPPGGVYHCRGGRADQSSSADSRPAT